MKQREVTSPSVCIIASSSILTRWSNCGGEVCEYIALCGPTGPRWRPSWLSAWFLRTFMASSSRSSIRVPCTNRIPRHSTRLHACGFSTTVSQSFKYITTQERYIAAKRDLQLCSLLVEFSEGKSVYVWKSPRRESRSRDMFHLITLVSAAR